ncbi:MAG TPA: class I SAM-dependent methyltransferase [Candidatus Acidoferrales bacterium]|nr:class I SAM-dependent methyltransferase [Candidatus Acidoferrales bacterium]
MSINRGTQEVSHRPITAETFPVPVAAEKPSPPPLPRRIQLKIKRIYLDLTGPRMERAWIRAKPLIASIEGWLTPNQEKWLFETAHSLPDRANIVEIGSFKGRSTCCLASGCRRTRKRVFAIDSFGKDGYFGHHDFLEEFSQNMKRCHLAKYVHPIAGLSSEVAKTWAKPIHMLFIDGSHEYADVLADFEGFFPHVVTGGIVALHDVSDHWPGPLRLWHDNVKHRLNEVGYCDSLAYGRK